MSSPFNAPYAISKHGAVTLAETLFHELTTEGPTVGVTCLCPGSVNTNIANAMAARPSGSVGSAKGNLGNQILEISQRALLGGLDPAGVGDQVYDAVLGGDFWLFTDENWNAPIAARATEVAQRLQPQFQTPPLG